MECRNISSFSLSAYTSDELSSFDGQYVCSAQLAECIHQLGLAPGDHCCHRPARKRPYRGGRRKQGRTIPVIISDRPASQPRTLHPLTTPTFDSARRLSVECDANSDNAICYSNLIKINTSLFTQEFFRHFKVMFFNTQSVRNKTTDICDHVMHANIDLILLCETWLRPDCNENDCVALTPPGFCLRSFLRMSGAGSGLAVLYRNSLTKKLQFPPEIVSTAFEICEVRISLDSHTVVFLSVYRPPPSRKNKLTNAMFLEQFTDLLESFVACDRLFVVGDLNVHFDNPSDPCTAALNAVLANLSLEQLVNVPTHHRGHTLDWLITNHATDVLDLTVADMLLSDHFIISFDLLLRKPGRVTKKVTSRNIRPVDMYAFRTDLRNVLECATQSESADPLSVYNTCLRQALDHHAPLVTRTVTDRTSAPWMTLEVKQAKVQWHIAERKWRQSGLTVHREIYTKQRNEVSNLISKAKKDYICEKIIDCDSSQELFRLSNQLMGTFRGTVLPSNIPPESLPDKFSEFFVRKIELIRSSLDPDRPFPCDTV